MNLGSRLWIDSTYDKIGHEYNGGLLMEYGYTYKDGTGPQDCIEEGVIVGGAELDGIAGVLWDVQCTEATARRDSDVIYRLYRQENSSATGGESQPMRGRCFISEPQRPYAIGEVVMLETRDRQHIFGTVQHIREMRTGSVSLILDIQSSCQ